MIKQPDYAQDDLTETLSGKEYFGIPVETELAHIFRFEMICSQEWYQNFSAEEQIDFWLRQPVD